MFSSLGMDYLTNKFNDMFKHTCSVCGEDTYYYSNLITISACQNCRSIEEKNKIRIEAKRKFEEANIDYKEYLKKLHERADHLDEDLEFTIEKESNRRKFNRNTRKKI